MCIAHLLEVTDSWVIQFLLPGTFKTLIQKLQMWGIMMEDL